MWLRMHKQSMWVAHLGSALYKEKQPRKNGLTDGMHTALEGKPLPAAVRLIETKTYYNSNTQQ